MNKRMSALFVLRVLVIALAVPILLLATQPDCHARTFICNTNPDYFSKRCTIHPYAVSKRVDGQDHKGHLVGCQFKSYTCMDGICKDNFGTAQVPFTASMDDLKEFCKLLCRNPECLTTSDPNSGWQ